MILKLFLSYIVQIDFKVRKKLIKNNNKKSNFVNYIKYNKNKKIINNKMKSDEIN